ncbi:MAG: T9SS type A sorting domain-containing protein, partial [Fibrobacter sp.]|nr:T9SS type A sorting domain-containing protein [Fibrobacter sp.]
VFNMQGRPVFSTKCEKGSIELNGISDGLYMVRVRSGSASLVQKISIK